MITSLPSFPNIFCNLLTLCDHRFTCSPDTLKKGVALHFFLESLPLLTPSGFF
nr:hypothetical protein Iba_scaffold8100CG0030 [Ipomoea batatas]